MIKRIRDVGQGVFLRVESGFNAVFGEELNPLYHLGPITFFLFWVIAISGLYLYIFFDTGIQDAYNSVEAITREQWYLGGVMRSLHRYASDAMVLTALLHMLRQFVMDRFRGFRWFSWTSGLPLLWLMYASGIGGYWLVWDEMAQFLAVATAEWLDWLPIFSEPLVRNFLNQGAMNDRFFTLLAFLHIGIPLMLLLFMWVHVQRITSARTNPPMRVGAALVVALIVLSLIKPAVSQPPANLDHVVTQINLDWFYLTIYPLIYSWPLGKVWALVGGASLLVFLLPWIFYKKAVPVAVVNPANCNGCGRCFADCPYSAVDMHPHPDKPGHQLAVVNADLCASCGICAGACPSSTPFRSAEDLVTGIDMPQSTVHDLRKATEESLEHLTGEVRLVVYGCDHGADVRQLAGPDVAVHSLECIGMLPPSFADYVLRSGHADGVLVTGCAGKDCCYRIGNLWTEKRFHGEREPHLRTRVARERVHVHMAGHESLDALRHEVEIYREIVRNLPKPEGVIPPLRTRRKA
jgi:quinol-cytochrome oxidoreductase complex cytochrome b subunit/coenzyme F420-reducing hydrogenase delta subunit